MPEFNGWEVLDILRQIQHPPRVIIITAHGGGDAEKTARERGTWAFVEKPYIIERIIRILKEARPVLS